MKTRNCPTDGSAGLVVVKVGGALLDDPQALEILWRGVRSLRARSPVLIVHGGGRQATEMARRLGHEPRFVQGRRVTNRLDLDIAQWTMRGELNTRLVSSALACGLPALGLSGVDGGMLRVSRRPPWDVEGEQVDFGWVGDVASLRSDLPALLLGKGFLPIIAPLGVDAEGDVYNVNADTVARSFAGAMQAKRLLLVTPSGGVRRPANGAPHSPGAAPDSATSTSDAADAATLLAECDAATFEAGRADGWICGGMQVKLEVGFQALREGVEDVLILSPDDLIARSRATRVVH